MNKFYFIILLLSSCIFISCSQTPQLEKSIGLDVEDKKSNSSVHTNQIVLVYNKDVVKYDLFDYICNKAEFLYAGVGYNKRQEKDPKSIPSSDLVDTKYLLEISQALNIDSSDSTSSIWIIESKNYVVVFLVDRM